MCKMFPSSLGPIAMRWFDALEEGSIGSFEELTRAFGARFITCSRVLEPVDFLLSMAMREGETLKTYLDWFWEMYNEVDGDFEDVVVRTFKVGLPTEHDLRNSLTMKSALNCARSWIALTSTRDYRRTRCRETGKLKCSQKRGILGEEGTIMTGLKEISLVIQHPRGFN